MRVTEEEYRQRALDDREGQWELYCGELRQKPAMSFEHNYLNVHLFRLLDRQLNPSEYDVRPNIGRVRRSAENYFIPDLYVIPVDLVQQMRREQPRALEAYEIPLPLVVEIWSPSTGDYDVETKLVEYQRRGDHEIWLIHPYERTLTAWTRQPDGTYAKAQHGAGVVRPAALPGVEIELEALFA
jgi:Uma2 family endonuclease